MLQKIDCERGGTRLDLTAWHKPLVSIIITHFNYSEFVKDAILSVLDQTHENWELVVVDDASAPEHRERLEAILSEITDQRVRYLPLNENVGQILSFFAGLDATSGEFCCLLDPDDRYAPTFIEEMLAAHMNGSIVTCLASCDQYIVGRRGIISSHYTTMRRATLKLRGTCEITDSSVRLFHVPAERYGCFWASTSSLMFRRAALKYARPHQPMPFKNHADTFLGAATHALGGSLFLTKPLVYRLAHSNNAWLREDLWSLEHAARDDAPRRRREIDAALTEIFQHNKAPVTILTKQAAKGRGILGRWKRSILKRLRAAKR